MEESESESYNIDELKEKYSKEYKELISFFDYFSPDRRLSIYNFHRYDSETLKWLTHIITERMNENIPAYIDIRVNFWDGTIDMLRHPIVEHVKISSLTIALILCKYEMVEYLLSRKNELQLEIDINIAIEYNNDIHILKLLLDHGAVIDENTIKNVLVHYSDIDIMFMLFDYIHDFNKIYSNEGTFLMMCIEHGENYIDIVNVVEQLIKRNASLDIQNEKGQNILHIACMNPFIDIHIIELLLHNGANINVRDTLGFTPMDYAYMILPDKTIFLLKNYLFFLARLPYLSLVEGCDLDSIDIDIDINTDNNNSHILRYLLDNMMKREICSNMDIGFG